jgi:SOS response regulatory protein OraA/RecX
VSFERLYELALKLLVRRERSLHEMREYLESKCRDSGTGEGDTEATGPVDQVLQRLVSLRYLDEERMAGGLIREQRLQARGPRSAWLKLRKRGISGWSLERVEAFWRESEDSNLVGAAGAAPSSDRADPSSEVEMARRWVLRRYRELAEPETSSDREARAERHSEKRRALAALVRRGYSISVALRALDFDDSES